MVTTSLYLHMCSSIFVYHKNIFFVNYNQKNYPVLYFIYKYIYFLHKAFKNKIKQIYIFINFIIYCIN